MVSASVLYVAVPVSVVVALGLIRKWKSRNWTKCVSNTCLRGKTFLITGANSGIGLETARALVERKARVIFACRDIEKAKKVVAEIRAQCAGGELIPMQLNLASFKSIEKFVEVVRAGFYKIDVLINNAGVVIPLHLDEKTEEGFEIHFGVNHLGHFYLTNLLIDLLKKASPSRIVIVTSTLHEKGTLDFNNLDIGDAIKNAKNGKVSRHNPGYCNSKLINVYHARALAAKYRDSGIDVYACSPGFCYTNLFRNFIRWYHYIIMAPVAFFFMKTAKQGSETVVHCATDYRLEGHTGKLYQNCTEYTSTYPFNKDEETKLWEVSEALVKARKPV